MHPRCVKETRGRPATTGPSVARRMAAGRPGYGVGTRYVPVVLAADCVTHGEHYTRVADIPSTAP